MTVHYCVFIEKNMGKKIATSITKPFVSQFKAKVFNQEGLGTI